VKKFNKSNFLPLMLASSMLLATSAYAVGGAVGLGAANNFAILAGSTITNTGSSVVSGDLGLSPGTSVTGFPPATLSGVQHVADALALQAKTDITSAYNDAAGRTPSSAIGAELGGQTLTPGVYSSGTFGLTGTLTLDAQGDPNAVFVFKAGSTLVTAGASSIVLTGGAQACNVFWQVGSSATLGANSSLKGTVLASASITLNTGAAVEGRLLAQSGAVTLDSNTVTKPSCTIAPPPVIVTPVVVATSTSTAVTVTSTTTPVQVILPAPSLPTTGGEPLQRNIPLIVAFGALLLSSAFFLRKRSA
jgi:hypothetical protein